MPDSTIPSLTLGQLRAAVSGPAAAIRLVTHLEPAGGPQDKVFPPTYQGAVYATERRRVNGTEVEAVLLDSVQSQANRMELALLQAYDDGLLKFPLMWVDFPPSLVPGGRITTLEAPHRIADAIFRESLLNGLPFRPPPKAEGARARGRASSEGERFAAASIRDATALFELCPTALIFGVWDSTGAAGGLGNKFARVLVSEIVGLNAVRGVRTSSRIDPSGIEKVDLYEDEEGNWTPNPDKAKKEKDKDDNDVPVPFKRKKTDKGKPSEINLGNVTPDLVVDERSEEPIAGGVTMSQAVQTTVLSLPGLRRLRFPDGSGKSNPEREQAARTVLAALALAAVIYQRDLQGYDLRSRCNLVPVEEQLAFEVVTTTANTTKFTLTTPEAAKIFQQAVQEAKEVNLPWREEPVILKPKPALVELVQRSRELTEVPEGE